MKDDELRRSIRSAPVMASGQEGRSRWPVSAFATTKDRVAARLIVRRGKDAARQDELFPV
jgi:hypothetical protein